MRRFFLLLSVFILPLLSINCAIVPQNPEEIAFFSWTHYKQTFIRGGRVFRPKNNNDTVSEGQAYGMIRAVLLDDRKTFDECLTWTEAQLSRKNSHGDRLLAWHFEDGKIIDTKAASDADIDYAYSLILASRKWGDKSYMTLAKGVLESVLDQETSIIKGRLYFLPWPKQNNRDGEIIALNPSYYAPSHFKLFFEVSGDKRWLELVDTTYFILDRLLDSPGEENKGGFVPDWIAVDQNGTLVELPGKPVDYGWDAVRVPLRIAADYYLYGDSRALGVLRLFSAFFEKEYTEPSKSKTLENALFYSAVYAATETAGSPLSSAILQRLRECIRKNNKGFYYNDNNDYYINSISWLPEYYNIIKLTGKLKHPPLSAG
ncbi:MAG: endoglucanase [Chlorobium sp.]|nr:MAG: endoglucanase [Chlorobium sp.]